MLFNTVPARINRRKRTATFLEPKHISAVRDMVKDMFVDFKRDRITIFSMYFNSRKHAEEFWDEYAWQCKQHTITT
jgi:hypothetical protein